RSRTCGALPPRRSGSVATYRTASAGGRTRLGCLLHRRNRRLMAGFPHVSGRLRSAGGKIRSPRRTIMAAVTTDASDTSAREAPLRDPRLAGMPSDRLLDELLARLCGVMGADVSQFLLLEDDQLRV